MTPQIFLPLLLMFLSSYRGETKYVIPSSHRCVGATFSLASRGNGSTPNSCMSCDPTYPTCARGCQKRINYFYRACDGICLPDGYYFDPKKEFDGCWEEVLFDMKIQVERCGCNSASKNSLNMGLMLFIVGILSSVLVL